MFTFVSPLSSLASGNATQPVLNSVAVAMQQLMEEARQAQGGEGR